MPETFPRESAWPATKDANQWQLIRGTIDGRPALTREGKNQTI
jgi:hypothetical protein